eukprot:437463-Prorocentrum_minimum.AAC.1
MASSYRTGVGRMHPSGCRPSPLLRLCGHLFVYQRKGPRLPLDQRPRPKFTPRMSSSSSSSSSLEARYAALLLGVPRVCMFFDNHEANCGDCCSAASCNTPHQHDR